MEANASKVNPEKVLLETDQGILESEEKKWGLPLKDVYKHGLVFYKDKDGKAVHLSYEDRLKLVAYTQQAAHGPLDANMASPLGVLDVIGRDRRAAWQALGSISHVQAIAGFVHTLDRLCPMFKPYIEAIHKDLENKIQQQLKKKEEEKSQLELEQRVAQEQSRSQNQTLSTDEQKQKIKEALNAQTYKQFLQYAQQQYPGNVDQQGLLIRQLQEQHYQQYIQQLAVDQRLANSSIARDGNANPTDMVGERDPATQGNNTANNEPVTENSVVEVALPEALMANEVAEPVPAEIKEEESDDDGFPPIDEARMWTRPDLVVFKQSALEGGGTITVGHGETVTVRVPTHGQARCLCWEFATDHYDIGFGLCFEWGKSPTSEVTIHVSEDSDDEDDDDNDYDEEDITPGNDPEAGNDEHEACALTTSRPPVSVVVPIFRRDCHTEVYAGSHTYPGDGVYLLKFDNTYSLWRSKTLYYKVYYTQGM